MRGPAARRTGFTLIELVVVVAIIAAVVAVSAPRLLPVLMYSTHEGAARRLANFGEAALAEAALNKETLTFKFDFEAQEYWLERLPEPPPDEDEEANTLSGDETKTKSGLPKDDAELERMAQEELAKELPNGKRSEDGLKVLDEQAEHMANASAKRARSVLGARADRVKHEEDALPSSQREGRKKPDVNEEELEPEEVTGPLLGRNRLPEDVSLALATIGGKDIEKGVAEVEITAAGLGVKADFWLMNPEGRTFKVTWDPATGRTSFGEERGE